MLDVTMTATLRPEIVDQTLTSFRSNLFGSTDIRLIINIDPVGDDVSPADVSAVAREHFGDFVTVRYAAEPSFPTALRWCWEQVTTPYFFNLEDDWTLLAKLDIVNMITVLEACPWLALLRLPKGPASTTHCRQSSSHKEPYYVWNGSYFECPHGRIKRNSYYGSPSLIRTNWARDVLPLMHAGASPEKQTMRLHRKREPTMWWWEYGVYTAPNTPQTILDTGTPWRHERGIRKNSYDRFTRWLESNTGSPNS